MRIYKNGKVEELDENEAQIFIDDINDYKAGLSTADNATREFFETLSSSETNSIAKIRAAAQKYLDDTSEVSK